MLAYRRCPCKLRLPFRKYSAQRISNLVLEEAYVPSKVEKQHTDTSYFKPPMKEEHFSLVLPPPNITGNLHLGHALTGTIQDIFVRWKQMHGSETLWVPGLDHAGIATQMVVEKQLWRKTGKSRHQMGRDKFVQEVLNWKDTKTHVIDEQLRRLGLSLDWSRKFFTMDPTQERIVSEAFVKLFDKGIIYRNEYLVNWSCFLRSAISDVEVNHLNVDGKTEVNIPGYENPVIFGRIFHFSYKLCDSDDEIIVATTRPETILGDVAVAVHPDDDRYTKFVGRKVYHPFLRKEIPVISDEFVDMNFETGAVKITPSHNHIDFSIAQKHSLECSQVFNEEGRIIDSFEDFKHLPRFEVRELILNRLKHLGLLRDIKEHKMTVPICSRSGDVVELLLKPQWFMRCSEMARRAIEDVKEGRLIIEPKQFEDNWFDWLENIRDWCISRQLWWGHRIPVYLCQAGGQNEWIAATQEELLRKASDKLKVPVDQIHIEQDHDVLDTWFSSALLPFSVFGNSDSDRDLLKYYPLSVMETGHDILFFWVARMVMLCTELTGKLPFHKILLHGIICDSQGRKMSKSLGNVISPENVIDGISLEGLHQVAQTSEQSGILTPDELSKTLQEQKKMFPDGIPECGVDALRYTLVSHNVKSHFINFDVQECYSNKLFCNKLWQATKFTRIWFEKISEVQDISTVNHMKLEKMDKWILSRYSCLINALAESIPVCDLYVATLALKKFLYNDLCDVYLETTKRGLRNVESESAAAHCWTLITVLDGGLRALHPFMPYVTQHLHQRLPSLGKSDLSYPEETFWRDEKLETLVDDVLETARGIRRLKKIFNITKKHTSKVVVVPPTTEYFEFENTMKDLTRSDSFKVLEKIEDIKQEDGLFSVKDTLSNKMVVHMSLTPELKNCLQMDQQKLEKQRQKLVKDLQKMNDMISGSTYSINVSTEMKSVHQKRIAVLKEKISRIDYIFSIV